MAHSQTTETKDGKQESARRQNKKKASSAEADEACK
jgi:hypothetical protein